MFFVCRCVLVLRHACLECVLSLEVQCLGGGGRGGLSHHGRRLDAHTKREGERNEASQCSGRQSEKTTEGIDDIPSEKKHIPALLTPSISLHRP